MAQESRAKLTVRGAREEAGSPQSSEVRDFRVGIEKDPKGKLLKSIRIGSEQDLRVGVEQDLRVRSELYVPSGRVGPSSRGRAGPMGRS